MGRLNKSFAWGFLSGVLSSILTIILIIAVGVYALLQYQKSVVLKTVPTSTTSEIVQADYNLTVESLEGKKINLNDFRDKVIFLNFWATWCGPCIIEMPRIQELYNEVMSEKIKFLLVSDEDTSTVRKFLKNNSYNLPIYILKNSSYLPQVFEHQGIPVTFILSKDGKIVLKHSGGANWSDPSVVKLLKDLQ